MHRRQMIDVIGQLTIEVPQWIVRQRGQMNYGIDRFQIGSREVTDIFPKNLVRRLDWTDRSVFEKVGIHTHDHVTSSLKNRYEHTTDITVMTSYEHPHEIEPLNLLQLAKSPERTNLTVLIS